MYCLYDNRQYAYAKLFYCKHTLYYETVNFLTEIVVYATYDKG